MIDTSTEKASIALAENGTVLSHLVNAEQKDHASWIQPAIRSLLQGSDLSPTELAAVAVTAGPGSYTGLRVGMATAKGLSYALKIPLIAVNTLEAMTVAAFGEEADLYCPLIDARRVEVFTAVYDRNLHPVIPPTAMELKDDSFKDLLNNHRILFFGNGHEKLKRLVSHDHAIFSLLEFDVTYISGFINKKYNLSEFADLIYSEPEYIKEFYINTLNKTQ